VEFISSEFLRIFLLSMEFESGIKVRASYLSEKQMGIVPLVQSYPPENSPLKEES